MVTCSVLIFGILSREVERPGGGGEGHFHSEVIGMLVVFFRV